MIKPIYFTDLTASAILVEGYLQSDGNIRSIEAEIVYYKFTVKLVLIAGHVLAISMSLTIEKKENKSMSLVCRHI